MKPTLSVISSVARGIIVSGAMIFILPLLFGANSLWYAMLLTEALVAIFGACFIMRTTRQLEKKISFH
jgi:Na+-driven multidrug efflux pump